MKIDTRIWRDVSAVPIATLIRNLAKGSVFIAGFGALTGTCFTLAWVGGTEELQPWQWTLCGGMTLCAVIVMVLGGTRMCRIIICRISKEESNSQPTNPGYRAPRSA